MPTVYDLAENLAWQWDLQGMALPAQRPAALVRARDCFIQALEDSHQRLSADDLVSLGGRVKGDPAALSALYRHPACPRLGEGEIAMMLNTHSHRWGPPEQEDVGQMVSAALAAGASATYGPQGDLLCGVIALGSLTGVLALLAAGASPCLPKDAPVCRPGTANTTQAPLQAALAIGRTDIAQALLDAGTPLEDLGLGHHGIEIYPASVRDWLRAHVDAAQLEEQLPGASSDDFAPDRL